MRSKRIIMLFSILLLMAAGCGKKEAASETVQTETVVETVEEIEPTTAVFIEPAEKFAGGNGTKEAPYQISNAQELALLSELCVDGIYDKLEYEEAKNYLEGYYVLTADIQLNDTSNIDN